MRKLIFAVLLMSQAGWAQETKPPIIDVHLHAFAADALGPPPLGMCTPWPAFPHHDPKQGPYMATFLEWQKSPPCEDPVWSPKTDQALMERSLAQLHKLNIRAITGGPPELVARWHEAAPDHIIRGLSFNVGDDDAPSPETLRAMVERGELEVLAEVTNQYSGIAPMDSKMAPYWALMEELDIPVGIHFGPGPPGISSLPPRTYRASLSSALNIEQVLYQHPGLRVYLMHAGFPMLDDLLATLYAHPQLYVGIGVIVYTQPRDVFYAYLKGIIDAGFGKRVMFGSDQMVWPETIERSVQVIEDASFLSENQKRDIFYNNAARFLRLPETESTE